MSTLDAQFRFLRSPRTDWPAEVTAGYLRASGSPLKITDRERAVHTYLCGLSGSGKSRALQSLIFQDLQRGQPLCLIDPMGDLFRAVREFIASCLEAAAVQGFGVRDLLPQYLFLDASDPANPIRLNPLEPQGEETSEEQVDDLLKAVERLLSSLEDQRRLRNVLRGTFLMIAELNRLPEFRRPRLPSSGWTYPLPLAFAAEILRFNDRQRLALFDSLPSTAQLNFRRQYWEFLAEAGSSQQAGILQSSWNVLQYLLDDALVNRVLGAQRSTVHLADVLRRGQNLFCYLPLSENLAGARFLGKFLTTKLEHAAYRRPQGEWERSYSLVLDEFHQFTDQPFADALTHLRKFGLQVTTAHQSQTQPPFDTPTGQALLRTIRGNSRLKFVFRLDRADAEILSRELFPLTQRRENFTATDRTEGTSEQTSRTFGTSSGVSEGRGTTSSSTVNYAETSVEEGRNLGRGESSRKESTSGTRNTQGTTAGRTVSATARTVYYTLEGERELFVNALQRLGDRECYVFTDALSGQLIETLKVPDSLYAVVAEDLPTVLMEEQRQRLMPKRRELDQERKQKRQPPVPKRRPAVDNLERVEASERQGPWGF